MIALCVLKQDACPLCSEDKKHHIDVLRTTWDHVSTFLVLIEYEVFDLHLDCMKKKSRGT